MHRPETARGHVRESLVAAGCGLLAGYFVGVGMMGSHAHVKWPALAGLAVGAASSLVASSRRVLLAFGGGCTAVISSVATIVLVQLGRGHRPIVDEFTLVHYGSTTQATARIAVILVVLICAPCVAVAVAVAFARRWMPHRTRQGTGRRNLQDVYREPQ